MSLILDALKKVEREKDAREPGVLVVGSVPWGGRARPRRPLVVALLGTALVALVAFALWPRDRTAPPGPPAPPAAPTTLPEAAPSSVPPPSTPLPTAPDSPPEPRPLSAPPAAPAALAARPAAPAPPEEPPLRLNAISQRDGKPMALINDRLVFEGDGFDGVKVLRIGEAEVEVEVRGRRQVLRF